MTKDEALKLALEALELHLAHHEHGCVYLDPAVTAIKEALAQPVQEPVATKNNEGITLHVGWDDLPVGTKLYTAPPQRPWVSLTDEERRVCTQSPFTEENYRAIEQALKEKNFD
jgi:hypothetical protein